MKQLTQKLKSGEMQILEASIPAMGKGQVLVQNFYSLISAGTEGGTVKAARKGYIDNWSLDFKILLMTVTARNFIKRLVNNQ